MRIIMKNIFFEVDVQYPKNFHDLHNDLQILPQRMKLEKVLKLVANFTDEKEYVIHMRNSKQALNHGLVLNNSLNSIKKLD